MQGTKWYVNGNREAVDLTTLRDPMGRSTTTVYEVGPADGVLVRTLWVRRGEVLTAARLAAAVADSSPLPPPMEPGPVEPPDPWTGDEPDYTGTTTPYPGDHGEVATGRKGPPGDKGPRGDRGPAGTPGGSGIAEFEYAMDVAATTATFEHPLGRDPVAIMVLVDGAVCDEYSVTFPVPGQQVRVGFDVNVRAVIKII